MSDRPRGWVLQVAWHVRPSFRNRQAALLPSERLTLGRGSPALGAGVLDHPGLSRVQVRCSARADAIDVEDPGSKNGILVDGEPVRRAVLREGAVLSLPGVHLVVRRGEVRRRAEKVGEVLEAWGDWLPDLRDHLQQWGPDDGTVLLLGETGTGKLEVARALHGYRGRGSLVRVNVRGWSEGTWQRELYGHVRGAFTGAHMGADGVLTRVGAGTVFFDEAGRMPRAAQEALLTLLDGDRTFRVLGDPRPRYLRARVVAASDQDIQDPDRFERALYHRLSRYVVELPPLRARREDTLDLAARAGLDVDGLDGQAALALLTHSWPGNVRELHNAVSAANAGDPLSDLLATRGVAPPAPSRPAWRGRMPATLEELQIVIQREGSQRAAADALHVSRSTLNRWLGRLRDVGG